MQNSIGTVLTLTTFGESHGKAVGGVLDGCPPGIKIDFSAITRQLERRSPSKGKYASGRKEKDAVEFLSGISEGFSIGTPIAFILRNEDPRSKDYQHLANLYRPSHADLAWELKFGIPSGPGGGRSSARALAPCVVAGTIAEQIIRQKSFSVLAWVSSIGPLASNVDSEKLRLADIEASPLRCPDKAATHKMVKWLDDLKKKGDTAGGTITCMVRHCPAGLGEPAYGKLHAALAQAMLSINSVKGFEIGAGFNGTVMTGSQYNDVLEVRKGKPATLSNNDGGVNGGISNGQTLIFRVALKPIPSIKMTQKTITRDGKSTKVNIEGRHDTCVLPRAVPIVEALTKLVIADNYLMQKMK